LIDYSDFVTQLLTMKVKDAKKIVQALPAKFEEGRDYLQDQLIPFIIKS
jgi:hypothetical protein